MSTADRNATEVLQDLRRLREDPSPEAAKGLLEDWADRQNTYDTTASSWRRKERS